MTKEGTIAVLIATPLLTLVVVIFGVILAIAYLNEPRVMSGWFAVVIIPFLGTATILELLHKKTRLIYLVILIYSVLIGSFVIFLLFTGMCLLAKLWFWNDRRLEDKYETFKTEREKLGLKSL